MIIIEDFNLTDIFIIIIEDFNLTVILGYELWDVIIIEDFNLTDFRIWVMIIRRF